MDNRDEVIELPESASETARANTSVQPPDPWVVDIDVYLEPEGSDPPFFLETILPVNSDGEIVFQNHLRDGFILKYNLKDPYETGYLFPDDKEEALYSSKGKGCPSSKGQWGQFKAEEVVKPGNTTLIVRNRNQSGHTGQFGYTLRVTKDKGATYLPLDPGGDNQNGQLPLQR
jgi:hypothetical protein